MMIGRRSADQISRPVAVLAQRGLVPEGQSGLTQINPRMRGRNMLIFL